MSFIVAIIDRSPFGSTRFAVLCAAALGGGLAAILAIAAAFSNHETLRWIGVFAVAGSVLIAGLTLWTPDLRRAEDREKVGLALLAAALFFGTGSFMALQNERVSAQVDQERAQQERGYDLAAEKRRLIVELGVQRDLTGIDLRQRDISGVGLRGRRMAKALLTGANLQGADLSGAGLRDASLTRARMGGTTLRNADLRGADLTGAGLAGADLRGADLRGTTGLRRARLRGALVSERTRWPEGPEAIDPRRAGTVCVGCVEALP